MLTGSSIAAAETERVSAIRHLIAVTDLGAYLHPGQKALRMGDHPAPSSAARLERSPEVRASRWWKGADAVLQSALVARLAHVLTLTADAEAFYLGSYRTNTTNHWVVGRDTKRDLGS
jgi:hypothetical protein